MRPLVKAMLTAAILPVVSSNVPSSATGVGLVFARGPLSPGGGGVSGYAVVSVVQAGGTGGFFAGAASRDLSLIAVGPYVKDGNSPRDLVFFNADGMELARHDVGNSTWAVAMTPDGSRTVAGSDDENLYVFDGTSLVHKAHFPGSQQVRGVAISPNGRYVAMGGGRVTVLDLDSTSPLDPIFVDPIEGEHRALDISTNGRYLAYGGQVRPPGVSPITIIGIYDLLKRRLLQFDYIPCSSSCDNGELRTLSISGDGRRIIAGDWAERLHYFVRNHATGRWDRVQTLPAGSRVYATAMNAAGTLAVVGTQGNGVRLYELSRTGLTLRWERPDPLGPPPAPEAAMDGGQRQVSITPDGSYVSAGTRGGGGGGGQIMVYDRHGNFVDAKRSVAVLVGGVFLGPNGAFPEVWFTRLSEAGRHGVFASWSGEVYFLKAL